MPNSNSKLIGTVKGAVNSAIKDALNNIIASTYITNVTWDSSTHTLSFYSGNILKYSCVIELGLHDDPTKPLYFLSKQDGSTVKLIKHGTHNSNDVYQTSTDASTWSTYTSGTSITLNKGEGVYFRIKNDRQTTFMWSSSTSSQRYIRFTITGNVEAYNNVNSLISPNFSSLTNLTTVAGSGAYCYVHLFYECTGLTKPPLLPATTLANYCYLTMFYGCTGLVKSPALPATTLKERSYASLFAQCSALNEIRIYATSISATSCLYNWVNGVSSTGDFYCVNGVNYPSGASGKPTNWTRHDIT